MRIDRCLVDANWGQSTAVVKKFCRESPYGASLMASHGWYVGASSVPMDEYRRKTGERVGLNWRVVPGASRHSGRHVIFDTNYWRSFVHARLSVAKGDPDCLTLCAGKAHRMLAEHLTAEYRVRTEGRGRTVDEWKLRDDGLDNHWLACLVGAAVAASI